MKIIRLALSLAIVAAGLQGASKQTEAEQLRRSLALAQAQLASAARERATLEQTLKAVRLETDRLAATAKETAHAQAVADVQASKERAAQQETARLAAQAAAQATAQAASKVSQTVAQVGAQAAAKNRDLSKAIATVRNEGKAQAEVATQQLDQATASNDANAAQVHQDIQATNLQAVLLANSLKLQIEQVKESAHSANVLAYMGGIGAALTLLTLLLKFLIDWKRHDWATAVTASAVTAAAKAAITEANQSVLAAVAEGQAHSVKAIDNANNLTQKVIDMRADFTAANAAATVERVEMRQNLVDAVAGSLHEK